ncbi:MAG: asparagine synthase (glutamine-hydrolyzing) [Pseudomonadales bacterium]|nr:asparagine synthase (glutamine-hydrolyzing) [Pseudomonadales bacterium]
MCGITGLINFNGNPVAPTQLKGMTDALTHRGPDDEGSWVEGCVGLGHRRLAIIDLSPAGRQPMISADHRYILSYNGELYNYQELKLELEREGYWFRSKTDSEVVLYALAHWREKALDRFNGMFALALWDRKDKTLLIARDRYGIKPLYYCHQNNFFALASEQKAIISLPQFERAVNKEALLEYFTFQNIFTDQTLLKDIHLLAPGHYGIIRTGDQSPTIKTVQYWDFNFQEPAQAANEQDYTVELQRLMEQAVNRQLVADTSIGCYLSGGMDSGTVTAFASRQMPFLHTFTVGFDLSSASGLELGYDERQKSEQMSNLFKTEHYEMVLKAGDMERCITDLVWHLEEPRVGQSYPNWYAAKLASKFNKVVLSGTGGDELFAGYPWRYYRGVSCQDFEQYIDKYYLFWHRLIPNSTIQKAFRPIWNDVKQVWTRDIMRDTFRTHAEQLTQAEDFINHSLYFEAKTFLHGLLVVEDKISMAHGLESRVPFLDNDLVDFALKLPVRMKLNNLDEVMRINENETAKVRKYFQKTGDGKTILRKAMARYIPEDISRREKQGFSAPDQSWFKGESIDYVKASLFSSNARIYDYLDPGTIKNLVNEHLEGKTNRRLLIWSLINFEAWLKRFMSK